MNFSSGFYISLGDDVSVDHSKMLGDTLLQNCLVAYVIFSFVAVKYFDYSMLFL